MIAGRSKRASVLPAQMHWSKSSIGVSPVEELQQPFSMDPLFIAFPFSCYHPAAGRDDQWCFGERIFPAVERHLRKGE
jgi:hypothetical protein